MQITHRQLIFGPHQLVSQEPDPGQAPVVIAGSCIYVLGAGSAEIRPIGDEHLVGEMGGVWAHPVRVADGVTITIRSAQGVELPPAEATLTEYLTALAWNWRCGDLRVQRYDTVGSAEPVYRVQVRLHNASAEVQHGQLCVQAHLKFNGPWFGGTPSGGGHYWTDGHLVLGTDQLQSQWGVAFGAAIAPNAYTIHERERGAVAELVYAFTLDPAVSQTWELLLVVGQQEGWTEAQRGWYKQRNSYGAVAELGRAALGDVVLECADPNLSRDFALAQANLRLLSANYPQLGTYFLAGLPEYPQLFGCDTTYTVPGAVAAGFASTARQALLTLACYAQGACGRVPHELTTNGRVFHPGNIQETPQFTLACWDYLRWTGDLEFARLVFPVCREGMLDLLPAFSGSELYPYGDGMVERLGMGSRKLDSACYAYAGLHALAQLAAALSDERTAEYQGRAEALRCAFERDWWLESEGMYADSMHSDGRLQFDGHWTVVLPVQLGLAAPERAAQVINRIEAEWVNAWGLVHTREREERVWTLPTGLLALAEFAQGRAEQGLRLMQNIALTARHGTLGTFKELIPTGLCFVQLWSAGLYLQCVIEGLLGLRPAALAHRLEVQPCMPSDCAPITLRGLGIGAHRLDLEISPQGLYVTHTAGPCPLTIVYAGSTYPLAVGEVLVKQAAKGGDGAAVR